MRKSDQLFDPSRLRYFLELASKKLDTVLRLIPALELEASKERLLGALKSGLESGHLDFSDLADVAAGARGFPLYAEVEFEGRS